MPKNKKAALALPTGKGAKADEKVKFLKFNDIKDSVTGYGRIIHYKSNNSNPDPAFNELEMIEEGQFVKGMKDGYCRSISAVSGQCAAGFHKAGVPNGKWVSYSSNGEFSHP